MHKLKWLYIIAAFFALTIEFNGNTFKLVSREAFESFQKDSESLSVGRMFRSEKEGAFSYSGFLGWNHPYRPTTGKNAPVYARFDGWGYELPGLPDKFSYQYYALENRLKVDDYEMYFSQSGGQSFIYHLMGNVSGTSGDRLVSWCRMLNAAFTAFVICCFLYWGRQKFGLFPSLFSFLILFTAPWLILFANNMLYVTGLFFLPMVCNLFYLEYCSRQNRQRNSAILWLTAGTVFLKCIVAGFDFIIPTLVGAVIPVILYGYLERKEKRKILYTAVLSGVGGLFAVVAALALLISQIAHFHHSWQMALDYIINTSERRTYGNQSDLKAIYQASSSSTLPNIWTVYSDAVAINFADIAPLAKIGMVVKIKHFIWAFLLLAMPVQYTPAPDKRQLNALMIATTLALAGPLGWFTIFKFHAISHTHMNFVIWYIPFMLFATLFIGMAVRTYLQTIKKLLFSPQHSTAEPSAEN